MAGAMGFTYGRVTEKAAEMFPQFRGSSGAEWKAMMDMALEELHRISDAKFAERQAMGGE